jgi:hypothetical protein
MADHQQAESGFFDPPEGIGERLALLARRFRPDVIRQRKIGGGKTVSYVPGEAVIERLNRACGTWNFRIVASTWERMMLNRWDDGVKKMVATEVYVYVVTGELEIIGLGKRQAQGVQAIDEGAGEDLLKGAATDALKKCARLFGVPVDGQ